LHFGGGKCRKCKAKKALRKVRKVRDFLHGDIVVFGDIANIAKIVMQIFIEPAWNAGERKKRTWH
jgi:hypothetical protein